ncbi:glycoside hydrolase family 172 protein [Paenibacillus sp. Soil522]|uniref:glycoside hydrolase family 172 protein n=1 Tax=Paenibacillus sp. Soil522 TaxID=1736388 RepID=UPI0019105CB2|nr:glycoside hydrolase family 172 protein [Paenibacillus sp. Soil522]
MRKVIIEMYWDGEDNPSVRAPLGDFFGIGHATCKHFVSLPLSMVFGEKRGPKGPFAAAMNSYFPMPFGSGAVIKIINESESAIENLFYYIDYELTDEPLTDDVGRFHAQYNQENPCEKVVHDSDLVNPAPWDLPGINLTGDDNYVILDAEGKGHYVGCVPVEQRLPRRWPEHGLWDR